MQRELINLHAQVRTRLGGLPIGWNIDNHNNSMLFPLHIATLLYLAHNDFYDFVSQIQSELAFSHNLHIPSPTLSIPFNTFPFFRSMMDSMSKAESGESNFQGYEQQWDELKRGLAAQNNKNNKSENPWPQPKFTHLFEQ